MAETCPYCKGSGKVKSWLGLGKEVECSYCDGTGSYERYDKYNMLNGNYHPPEDFDVNDPNG